MSSKIHLPWLLHLQQCHTDAQGPQVGLTWKKTPDPQTHSHVPSSKPRSHHTHNWHPSSSELTQEHTPVTERNSTSYLLTPRHIRTLFSCLPSHLCYAWAWSHIVCHWSHRIWAYAIITDQLKQCTRPQLWVSAGDSALSLHRRMEGWPGRLLQAVMPLIPWQIV